MSSKLTTILLLFLLASTSQAADRPNVILIMADDLGVEGLGCYGGTTYRTPALDRLAKEGMRFTHAYAQPLCTNTRVQIMTGLYNHRNWVAFGILESRAKTFGHWMQEAGYRTCIVGKWQLQSYDPPDYPGAISRRGIGLRVDRAGFHEVSLWHTGHTEVKGSRYADPVVLENGKFRKDTKGRYGADIWVAKIREFMARNRQKPFFIYYPMALPHNPFVPTPDSREWSNPEKRSVEHVRFFKDMVEYTDKIVGRIVSAVDTLGLKNNTLIIFYSDNGTNQRVTSQTVRGPIRGGKGLTTDAGTLVPLIVRWPGRVAPAVSDDLVDSTDFLPTILEAAQRPLANSQKIDGRSFYRRLIGKPYEARQFVFCHYDPRPGWDKDQFRRYRFIRDKRFKLYDDGRLFDVSRDSLEQRPIVARNDSPKTRLVRRRLAEWMKKVSAD